ncbi:MAG TPA: hypothetical protein VK816_02905 [Jatrophihabitantaceae bacterium]|nr:hypothetical protein [Jatrophihabitantaceae bacterium]
MAEDPAWTGGGDWPVPARVERGLDAALDHGLRLQRGAVIGYLDRLRARSPDSPQALIRTLERRYLASVATIGAVSGGTAAVPGVGTATALASGIAEVAAFIEATSLFTLAMAEVHGVRFEDPEVRRALVLGIILGDIGATAIEAATGSHWAPVLARRADRDLVGSINKRLLRRFLTHFGGRQGALAVGRALPFGIGAGVGAAGNVALGRASVRAARRAFGPPPETFGPRIIDGRNPT